MAMTPRATDEYIETLALRVEALEELVRYLLDRLDEVERRTGATQ